MDIESLFSKIEKKPNKKKKQQQQKVENSTNNNNNEQQQQLQAQNPSQKKKESDLNLLKKDEANDSKNNNNQTQKQENQKQQQQKLQKSNNNDKYRSQKEYIRQQQLQSDKKNIYEPIGRQISMKGIGLDIMKNMINDEHKFNSKVDQKMFILDKFQKQFSSQKKIKPKEELKSQIRDKMEKQLKIFQVPDEKLSYQMFLPMNNIWKQYIQSLIKNDKSNDQKLQKIMKADFHGSIIQILKAKCKSYEGQQGIVLQEKLRSFRLITQENKIITVLKQNCIFLVPIQENQIYKIYGAQLQYRPSDRSKIKLKFKNTSKFILENV